jgi:hypothetical protein
MPDPLTLEIGHPRPRSAQPDDFVTFVAQCLELLKNQEPQAHIDRRQMCDFHGGKRNARAMSALVRSSGFVVAALIAGGASLLAVLVARGALRSIALGISVVVAVLGGLSAEDVLDAALPIGLALIALGAIVSERRPLVVRAAALGPGGVVLVTVAADGPQRWARVLAFVTVIAAGPAAAAFDRHSPSFTFGLLAISALGAYATVPDTEQARALVGGLLPVGLVALGFRRVPESSGPTMGVALLAWVALVGGVGRPGSVVGAIGCLGVLALGPLARRNAPALVVAVHVLIVVVASRVAGLRHSAWTAAAVLLPVMLIAATLLAAGGRIRKGNPP